MFEYLFTQTPFRFFTEGLWRDEAFSVFLAEKGIAGIITTTVNDFNPPLYYFLLYFWMGIFGQSEVAIRSISVIFYVLSVFCVYEIFKLVLKKTHFQSAIYTALFACNPLLLYYAFEARMYTMLLFFALASTYLLLKKESRFYLLVLVLGLYTHYFMMLVVASQFLYLVLVEWKNEKQFFQNQFFRSQILSGLLFLPWLVYFLSQNASVSGEFWIERLKEEEKKLIPAYLFSGMDKDYYAPVEWNKALASLLKNFSIFAWLTMFIGVFFSWKKNMLPKPHLLFFISFALPVVAVLVATDFFKPLFLPRYLITASAMLSLCLVLSISVMPRLLKFAFIGMFIFFLFQFNTIQLEYRNRGKMRELAQELLPVMKPVDVVYFTNDLDLLDGMYYFGKDRTFIYGMTYGEIPVYVGKVVIPPTVVREYFPAFPAKAYVIEHSGKKEFRIESDFTGLYSAK